MPRPPASERPEELARRVAALEASLHDLADNQRRLHGQVAAILDHLDAAGAEAAGPAAAMEIPAAAPPRGLKRFIQRVLRSSLRMARRFWQSSDPALADALKLSISVSDQPATRLLTLGVVILGDADGGSSGVREALSRQSEIAEKVVIWDRDAGTCQILSTDGDQPTRHTAHDKASIVETMACEIVLTGSETLERLPATAFETARLTFAAEDLAFLEVPVAGTGAALFVRSELWHPETGIDVTELKQQGRRAPAGKVLPGGRFAVAPQVASQWQPAESYRLPRRRSSLRHTVRPLAPAGRSREEADVLILLSSPLAGGLERLVADLLRELASGRQWLMASLVASDSLQRSRLAHLERLHPHLYPLADYLPTEVIPSALVHLIRRHRVQTVLHLGIGELPEAVSRVLTSVDPAVRIVDRPMEASGSLQLCGVDTEPFQKAAQRRKTLRRELEVPEDAILVAMVSDLIVDRRPEDFLALAHRFRDDARFVFLLVGRGPLAGTLSDLERYLAPRRFHRLADAPLADILAAADIACSTSEPESLPYFALEALAAGLAVVAADVGGLSEVLNEGPCGVTAARGNLAAFETAIRSLSEPDERRQLGAQGRRLVERRFRLDDAVGRYRELLE